MVNYTFILHINNIEDEYSYAINLDKSQEDNPDLFFPKSEREKLRNWFQEQSLYKINDDNLNKIIETWIKDIEEGFRDSSITMALPLLISQMKEAGNQEIPHPIYPDLSGIEPISGMLPPLNFN
ncbi:MULTISPECIES: hypothetical protein [Moorena]|uniref:Uncharacterized protein n=1 Tax=Moorena producens 3L TaxID=489825 RepID=F4XPT5_9CYAN|nr:MULTISPECIES: hypothetical protein [Moorena]EGJ32560.1 hypothetical protein LYNGBM3L_12230 [Moorena producens 3L]EGJ33403.1 hypothetical protein LYNGBM3L_36260 [Moorena producens 3L]NEP66270.1 hypothetical protein [Moorena sp. SIO3A5]OLT56304.1 hypothetical protein BI334_32190 [Moorena producens 3L]OLT64624.1 hypothetical protein BI334_05910 [Moorena producens 3L]